MDRWKLNLLGGLCLERNGIFVDQFPTRRAAMMLARLALSRNGAVGRDELAEEFWPEDYLDTTRLRLRQELKRLRTSLGEGKDLVDADRTWIRIDLESVEIDTREFERTYARAQAADGSRKAELLERVCSLYQGPLLPEFSEHWVFASRMDLREKFEAALSEFIGIHSSNEDHAQVIDWAMRGLRANPSNEKMVIALAKAQAATGDTPSATKTIEDFERVSGTSEEVANLRRSFRQQNSFETPAIGTVAEAEILPSEIPSYFDAFIGRDSEFDIVWQLLNSGARCVTLVGPGGVGKTRLSSELARRYQERGNRVHFLSMEEVSGSHLKDRIDDLVRPGKPALLVLDNAESDIESAAQTVSMLLRGSAIQVLTTSRQRLGISGERSIELNPILTPVEIDDWEELLKIPSVALFIERARSHDPSFQISRDEAVDVVALMQRLEGLPLAIELAAAKAANVGLKELAGKLDSMFTVLVTKRRDVPARQRSLWATIDWSYQNLESESRRTLEMLSFCPGGCGLEVAEAVLGKDAAEQFDDLKDRSLVVTVRTEDGRNRYRLLEPIREFVASTIEPETQEHYIRTYASCLADRLNKIGLEANGPNEGTVYAEKGREFDNVMMLMDWGLKNDLSLTFKLASLMWRYWSHMGHRSEGHRMLMKALERSDAPINNDYSLCLFGAAYSAYLMGRINGSDELFKKSMEVHLELGLNKRANWITLNQTCIAEERGDFKEMFRLAEESLVGFEESEELLGLAIANADMSLAASLLGQFDLAKKLCEEAFVYRFKMDSPVEIGRGYVDKGRIAYEEGELLDAERYLLKPISEFEKTKQLSLQFHCYQFLADTYIDSQNWSEARQAIQMVRKLEDRVGRLNDVGWCDRCESLVDVGESKLETAKEKLGVALQLSIRDEYERGLVEGCIAATILLQAMGDETASAEIAGAVIASHRDGYGIRPSRLRWLKKLSPTESGDAVEWMSLASKSLQILM